MAEVRTVPALLARQEAEDGETCKDLLELEDGEQVEVVLLRYGERFSVCVSTQVGCACGCVFCATGQAGFARHLSGDEIVSQVLHGQRELAVRGGRLSNVVLMGMGEPLLNYDETLAAIRRLVCPRGLGFVQRRVTLSTVGIAPGIERLAGEKTHRGLPLRVGLAVSLHAATDDLRDQLVPLNKRHPLDELFAAVRGYVARTGRRVMFEWVMIDRVNDSREQAEALAARLEGLPAHVNLIRLNPTPGYEGRPSRAQAVEAFANVLDRRHVPHTMRQRRGGEIEAGCGQLRHRRWRGRRTARLAGAG
jgi:23S rRNA (adenine2503-C2)-methyltransferase